MAIKGNAYLKTTWAFEERPVASSKLNTWDDRIETSLELMHSFMTDVWGGVDGVVRDAVADDLKVVASSPVSLSVRVNPGLALISRFPYKLNIEAQTADVIAPISDPRIDLVQARLDTWDVSIKIGTEAASPVAPTPDVDAITLAHLSLRVGMVSITDVDDSVNGFVIDTRSFL